MSRDAVLLKLREVPVFGLLTDDAGEPTYLKAEDGCSSFFLDHREAREACKRIAGNVRVQGTSLDNIYFDPSTRLKPSDACMKEARAMVRGGGEIDVSVPLFAIDGMQVLDKDSGIESTPLFFSRGELLEFAKTCMDDGESRVLLSDLAVVVDNMTNGPAGLLRNCKLFPTAPALVAMDEQEARQRQSLFPDQRASPANEVGSRVPDAFKGLLPW